MTSIYLSRCPKCNKIGTIDEINQFIGYARVESFSTSDGSPNFGGYTDIDYDSGNPIGWRCRECYTKFYYLPLPLKEVAPDLED